MPTSQTVTEPLNKLGKEEIVQGLTLVCCNVCIQVLIMNFIHKFHQTRVISCKLKGN